MSEAPVQRRLQFVLRDYGKRPTENIVLNYFGLANEVFTITTHDGKFVIKNCFKNNTAELVAVEAALIEHLTNQGVPTPKLVPTKKGEPFLFYDGHHYLMSEFLDGHAPTWEEPLTEVLVAESMKAMAEFHDATESFVPPYDTGRIEAFDFSRIRAWFANLQEQLETDSSHRQSVLLMKALLHRYNALLLELESECAKQDLSVLQRTFIHGDLHCFNLIYDRERTRYIGIIDFDFIRTDYRLVDFLWSSRSVLWGYVIPKTYGAQAMVEEFDPPAEDMLPLTIDVFEIMVAHYRKHTRLSDAELRLLPLFAKALPLYTVRFFSLLNSEAECLDHLQWFTYQLDQLESDVNVLRAAIDQVIA